MKNASLAGLQKLRRKCSGGGLLAASISIWLCQCCPAPGQQAGPAAVPNSQPAGGQIIGNGNQRLAPQPAPTEPLPQPRSVAKPATPPPPATSSEATALPLAQIAPPFQYPDVQALSIDLPTALRLVNASNPTIALARERVREAQAALMAAQVLWLPNLQTGPAYERHDGQLQNSRGDLFTTSKSNFFEGGGAVMSFQTSDALFAPLIARRLLAAQAADVQVVTYNIQLNVALAYLDLLYAYGALAVNADSLARAEYILDEADKANKLGYSRSPADVTRARGEVQLRREQQIALETQTASASARLAQLLLLQPSVDLHPADPAVVPITLVPLNTSIDELVATGLLNRPELAESRALVAAAIARWRQARIGPFLPQLDVSYFAGTFGGGIDNHVTNFDGRGDGTAQAIWTFSNLGLGNVAQARLRRAQMNEANYHVIEVQAQVAAEVTTAVKWARTRERSLRSAQEAVEQAVETWRRLKLAAFGMLTKGQGLVNTLEPVIAEQALDTARVQYLVEVIEYNKAQFRLYQALGQPPLEALPQAVAAPPVTVPAAPQPYVPSPPPKIPLPPPPKGRP